MGGPFAPAVAIAMADLKRADVIGTPAAIEAAGAVVAHDPDCDDAECEGCGPRASAGAPF